MCGVLSIINFKNTYCGKQLIDAAGVIRHRGPDDEGFLTWSPGETPTIWAGKDTSAATANFWKYPLLPPDKSFRVGFGHRRLSILDLSPGGHQPMLYADAGLALTFNGEVYNYLEIKAELLQLGHGFKTTSDTEVLLHAWQQWGVKCLSKLNGMFAFVLLDYRKNELFAVRDRFGVKPLHYYRDGNAIYLASEIKQIKTAPGYQFALNETIARQFLATGATDHGSDTFCNQITQLLPGHYLRLDLSKTDPDVQPVRWYTLIPKKWQGSFDVAAGQFRALLTDAVNLRLRSDVKVGSALSGGLDSSSIVCIMAELLRARGDFAGQETVTACFENLKYDEWNFARQVIEQTKAHPHRVFPTFRQLQTDIDAFLWHQDEPVGSTSVFSQWAVFKESHDAGLTVMIDGQGADEQLAGYGGNDISLYAGLLKHARLNALLDEAKHYKKEKGNWPKGFILAAMQLNLGKNISRLFPAKLRITNRQAVSWVQPSAPANLHDLPAASLRENLLRQVYEAPLPALLRYEDRNSMAWSVESRTPFMDFRLLEFNLGLPEQFIYKRGVRKTILREAMRPVIPESITNRKDKMGFVTPEEIWLKGEGKEWFSEGIEKACRQFDGHLLNAVEVRKYVGDVIDGKRAFDFIPWRIFCFHKWYQSQS